MKKYDLKTLAPKWRTFDHILFALAGHAKHDVEPVLTTASLWIGLDRMIEKKNLKPIPEIVEEAKRNYGEEEALAQMDKELVDFFFIINAWMDMKMSEKDSIKLTEFKQLMDKRFAKFESCKDRPPLEEPE